MDQRTNVLRGSAHQTRRYVGMDFVDPPVGFVRLARALGADRADALASALIASQAISLVVDRSFVPG